MWPRRRALFIVLPLVVASGLAAARLAAPRGGARTIAVGLYPGAVAVDTATSRGFVANTGDDTITMFDTRSDTNLRTIHIAHQPLVLLADRRRARAFVLDNGAGVTELDAATGGTLRRLAAPNGVALGLDPASGHLLVVAGGRTSDDSGSLAIVDADTGIPLHTTGVGASPNQVVVDERLHRAFVANQMDKTLSVVDTRTGRLIGTLEVGAPPEALAIDAQTGLVFATDAFGGVTAFRERDGQQVDSVAAGVTPMAAAVDSRTGRAFVVNDEDGTVSMLDARTGAMLRAIPVAPPGPQVAGAAAPADIAVDEQHSRVFVLVRGRVAQLNSRTGALLPLASASHAPWSLAVDPATATLFVTDRLPEPLEDRWGWLPEWLRRWLPQQSNTTGSVNILREG